MIYLDQQKIAELSIDEIVRYELVRAQDLVEKLGFTLFMDTDGAKIQFVDADGFASDLILMRGEHLAGVNKMLDFELRRREARERREGAGRGADTHAENPELETRLTELEQRVAELVAACREPVSPSKAAVNNRPIASDDPFDSLSASEQTLCQQLMHRAEAMGSSVSLDEDTSGVVAKYKRSYERDPKGKMYFTRNNAAMPFHHHSYNQWLFKLPEEMDALKQFIEADEEIYAAHKKAERRGTNGGC